MAILEFEEVRLDPKISFGFRAGPRFKTTITTNPGGFEQRNIDWSAFRQDYSADFETKDQAELNLIRDFFINMRGRGVGFRFFDWRDYCSDQDGIISAIQDGSAVLQADELPNLPPAGQLTAQVIATAIAATTGPYQLIKTYTVPSYAGDAYVRTINKPAPEADRVRIYVDAVEDGSATYDPTTGEVTLSASPAGGEIISADYIFDVPSRFDSDYMPDVLEFFNVGSMSVEVVEVRL